MSSFSDIIDKYDWDTITKNILKKTDSDVRNALWAARNRGISGNISLEHFMALVSPAAFPYIDEMVHLSHNLTIKRFGKTVKLFTPMYLSNECQNICNYCGFSINVNIKRKTLNEEEIIKESEIIKKLGYNHVLLVTGESNRRVGIEYLSIVIKKIRPLFSNISLEVQPMEEEDYRTLIGLGVNAVLVYQETYNKRNYNKHHPKGRKSDFIYRLNTHDRLGRSGICKIGLGVLLGLEDWRTDSVFCAAHLKYLEKKYWKSKYSISFPRLRPHRSPDEMNNYIENKFSLTDKELVQLICAYRLFNEDVELTLSTRESELFRDHAIYFGITHLSGDSKTNPGGHIYGEDSLEQFEVSDKRLGKKLAKVIAESGYDPVWKDWDKVYD